MKARVEAICSSSRRQEPKVPSKEGFFDEGQGLRGDSHYGMKERQISLLRLEDIREAEKEAGFPFPYGSLAENLVLRDLPEELPLGTLLRSSGGVVLRVAEKGKRPGEPHSYDYRGWCLLPVKGYFLDVVHGGAMLPGEEMELESSRNAPEEE
ncbi:MAG TPA: MOSC domain-containing protein [Synergistaceae bacterium]|nr:MOSC domain-containing protein [Synergistaceae bacterium]HPJ26841.1 MOSC domain-containing protein [Synergistaceae bacterium]HPQ36271.1 MOSC domain-containing protein [Synergistaceae bacterium]